MFKIHITVTFLVQVSCRGECVSTRRANAAIIHFKYKSKIAMETFMCTSCNRREDVPSATVEQKVLSKICLDIAC